MNRFLSPAELAEVGFRTYGRDVQVDRSVILINPQQMSLGSRVRIDALSLLVAGPAGLEIGSNVHVGSSAQLFGASAQIVVEDFAGISPRASLFTATDDFVGGHLVGPTIPDRFRNVRAGKVILRRHAVVGVGSLVLPNVVMGWGATVGAQSLVRKSVPDLFVMFGCPARKIATRSRDRLERLEGEYLRELSEAEAGWETGGSAARTDC